MRISSTSCAVIALLLPFAALAKPPECREPGAPSGCFNLVPVEVCDMARVIDPETGTVIYPCGFKIVPKKNKWIEPAINSPTKATSAPTAFTPKIEVRYKGSTIKDNGDGTSTITHGPGVTETINTQDKERTVKEYKERGIHIK
jgi:hypothetical protein